MTWPDAAFAISIVIGFILLGGFGLLLVGAAFYYGGWLEHKRGYIFDNAVTKAFQKRAAERATLTQGWGAGIDLEDEKKGLEHPSGPPPPTPDQINFERELRAKPKNWVEKLKTGVGK